MEVVFEFERRGTCFRIVDSQTLWHGIMSLTIKELIQTVPFSKFHTMSKHAPQTLKYGRSCIPIKIHRPQPNVKRVSLLSGINNLLKRGVVGLPSRRTSVEVTPTLTWPMPKNLCKQWVWARLLLPMSPQNLELQLMVMLIGTWFWARGNYFFILERTLFLMTP